MGCGCLGLSKESLADVHFIFAFLHVVEMLISVMIEDISSWLGKNYEWLFSGLGVALLTVLISVIFQRGRSSKQSQKVGDDSSATQAGRDVNNQ